MKTADAILKKYRFVNDRAKPSEIDKGTQPMYLVAYHLGLKAMEEYADQFRPAIKKERLVEIMEKELHVIHGGFIDPFESTADAILSELGQPPKPEPLPITLPTDEEIMTELGIKKDAYLCKDDDVFMAGARWMRSEIEKRMKGGEG